MLNNIAKNAKALNDNFQNNLTISNCLRQLPYRQRRDEPGVYAIFNMDGTAEVIKLENDAGAGELFHKVISLGKGDIYRDRHWNSTYEPGAPRKVIYLNDRANRLSIDHTKPRYDLPRNPFFPKWSGNIIIMSEC